MKWFTVVRVQSLQHSLEIQLHLRQAQTRITIYSVYKRRRMYWCYCGKAYTSRHELLSKMKFWQEEWVIRDATARLNTHGQYNHFPGV